MLMQKMNVLMRSRGDERNDRQPVKRVRQKAPSFSNGGLGSGKLARVSFNGCVHQSLTCHTNVLSYWSPRLRAIVKYQERNDTAKHPSAPTPPTPELGNLHPGKPPHIMDIMLLNVTPKTFAIFLDWAMCDKIPDTKMFRNEPVRGDIREGQSWKSFYNCQPEAPFLEAYIFGRRYEIHEFRNDMFDCLYEIVTMRTKGKEDDDTGSLMPSIFVLHRAVTKLEEKDPMRVFLTKLFNWFVPNQITSEAERLCAIELHEEHGFQAMHDTEKTGPIRKGYEEMDALQDVMYCYNNHEHVEDEHLEDDATKCWATPDETLKYWKRRLSDVSAGVLGNYSGDESDAEMTDNSTDVEMDNDRMDDGLCDLASGTFNVWDSVEPDDPKDKSFIGDDGSGGEDEEDEIVGVKADDAEAQRIRRKDIIRKMKEAQAQREIKKAKKRAEEERARMASQGLLADDRMEGIERPAEETYQGDSETVIHQPKTCKEVLGQDLWDFPSELDAETMDKLASPNEPPGGYQGEVAERYRVPW